MTELSAQPGATMPKYRPAGRGWLFGIGLLSVCAIAMNIALFVLVDANQRALFDREGKVSDRERVISTNEARSSALQIEIKSLEDRKAIALQQASQAEALKAQRDDILRSLQSLQGEQSRLTDANSKFSALEISLRQKVDDANLAIGAVGRKLDELNGEFRRADDRVQAARRESEAAQREAEDAKRGAADAIAQRKSRDDMQKEADDLRKTLTTLRPDFEDLKGSADRLSKQVASLEQKRRDVETEINRLEPVKQDVARQADDATQRLVRARTELELKAKEISALDASLEQRKKDMSSADQQLAGLGGQVTTKKAEFERLNLELDQLGKRRAQLSITVSEDEGRARQAAAVREENERKLATSRGALASASDEVATAQARLAAIKEQITAADDQARRATIERDKISRELQASVDELRNVRQKLDEASQSTPNAPAKK